MNCWTEISYLEHLENTLLYASLRMWTEHPLYWGGVGWGWERGLAAVKVEREGLTKASSTIID